MASEEKKVEPVVLTDSETGKTVVLEFNRAVVKKMEREGLPSTKIGELVKEQPFNVIDRMVYYSMLMHQPDATMGDAEELCESIGYDESFVKPVMDLYAQTATSMQTGKNARWAIR